jgi:hypothetical protein
MNTVVNPQILSLYADSLDVQSYKNNSIGASGSVTWGLEFAWVYPKRTGKDEDFEPMKSAGVIGYKSFCCKYIEILSHRISEQLMPFLKII